MAEKIFISHAFGDTYDADEIESILVGNGIQLKGPASFIEVPTAEYASESTIKEAIKAMIKSSAKVVLVSSKKNQDSNWVNYELGLADAFDKPIIIIGKKDYFTSNLTKKISGIKIIDA